MIFECTFLFQIRFPNDFEYDLNGLVTPYHIGCIA